MKFCPNCNLDYDDKFSFCHKCGKRLEVKEEKKICANCGKEIKTLGRFCPYCGSAFVNETQDVQSLPIDTNDVSKSLENHQHNEIVNTDVLTSTMEKRQEARAKADDNSNVISKQNEKKNSASPSTGVSKDNSAEKPAMGCVIVLIIFFFWILFMIFSHG